MDMKRVEEIEKSLEFAEVLWHKPMLQPDSAECDMAFLIQTIKQQQEQINKYKSRCADYEKKLNLYDASTTSTEKEIRSLLGWEHKEES